jgi:hypothetical protein
MNARDKYLSEPINSWTLAPSRRWFARCDVCEIFRLWADYFETYRKSGWQWECERCLLATITRVAEESLAKELAEERYG